VAIAKEVPEKLAEEQAAGDVSVSELETTRIALATSYRGPKKK